MKEDLNNQRIDDIISVQLDRQASQELAELRIIVPKRFTSIFQYWVQRELEIANFRGKWRYGGYATSFCTTVNKQEEHRVVEMVFQLIHAGQHQFN